MSSKQIYVITEPSYVTSAWFSGSIKSLYDTANKNHLSIVELADAQDINNLPDEVRTVIVVSSSSSWTGHIINILISHNIKPLLIGAVPNKFGEYVSGIVIDRGTVFENITNYFYSNGRKNIALVGTRAESSNDLVKIDAFVSASAYLGINSEADNIFYMTNDISEAVNPFLEKVAMYDAVMCPNDYVAAYLLKRAAEMDIHVPDDLWVSGFGNLLIGSCTKPTLTTASIDYSEMGVQAINLWKILDRSEGVSQVSATVKCKLMCRGSTGEEIAGSFSKLKLPHVFKETRVVGVVDRQMRSLENCLRQCDELDFKIINAILSGDSYEKIENDLYVSHGTLRYRTKKMFVAAGAEDKKQFLAALTSYVPNITDIEQTLFRK